MRIPIASLLLLVGCSGLRPYPTDSGGNVTFREKMDGGVSAVVHVHRVDAQCRTGYQGTVSLDRPSVTIDVPEGRMSYLLVEFDTSGFFAGNRSTSFGVFINPGAGSRYSVYVRYRESIYNVAVSETDRAGQRRLLPRRDLGTCLPTP